MRLSKLVRRSAVAVALLGASAVVGLASPASANLVGLGSITCTSVTFSYTLFPGLSTTNAVEAITISGGGVTAVIGGIPFSFAGTGASNTVFIPVVANTETITASATWVNSVHGPGSGSFSAVVHQCGQGCEPALRPNNFTPPECCPPGSSGSVRTCCIASATCAV